MAKTHYGNKNQTRMERWKFLSFSTVWKKKTTATKLYTHILYLNNVTFVQTEEDYTLIVCEQCNNTFDERK